MRALLFLLLPGIALGQASPLLNKSPVYIGRGDTKIEQSSDDLRFYDANNPSGKSLFDLATTSISGVILQSVTSNTSETGSGSNTVPLDDTTPLYTETNEITTVTITPTSANSTLYFVANVNVAPTSDVRVLYMGFWDGVGSTGASAGSYLTGVHYGGMTLTYLRPAGNTNAQTWRLGVASDSGNVSWNRGDGWTRFNGTLTSSITIMELSE
jgi:hypothetical protein